MGDVDDSTLWEATKAVLRGYIISYAAAETKRSEKRLTEIDSQLVSLEASYRTIHELELLNKITALQYDYNSICPKMFKNYWYKSDRDTLSSAKKPHRLLASQLRQTQDSGAIHCIK